MTHFIAFIVGYMVGKHRTLKHLEPYVQSIVDKVIEDMDTAADITLEEAHEFGLMWRHAACVWRDRALEMQELLSPSRFDDREDPDPMTKH